MHLLSRLIRLAPSTARQTSSVASHSFGLDRAKLISLKIHGFPMVCTSIGLTHKGVPVIGVIYNPFMDQLVSPMIQLRIERLHGRGPN